jgi:hypothetical protein
MVSVVGEQVEPCTRMPPMHLTITAGVPGRTVPVRLASAGWKIAWLARSVMSKPFRASEPWMNTETLNWVPAVPEKLRTLEGHVVAPDEITQTSPTKGTLTKTVTLCDNAPLVPVTRTVWLPEVLTLTVRVAVPEVVMLVGLMVAVRPADGARPSDTTPVKPLTAAMVMVDVAEEPVGIERLDGLAEMVKSGCGGPLTVTESCTACDVAVLCPVTCAV